MSDQSTSESPSSGSGCRVGIRLPALMTLSTKERGKMLDDIAARKNIDGVAFDIVSIGDSKIRGTNGHWREYSVFADRDFARLDEQQIGRVEQAVRDIVEHDLFFYVTHDIFVAASAGEFENEKKKWTVGGQRVHGTDVTGWNDKPLREAYKKFFSRIVRRLEGYADWGFVQDGNEPNVEPNAPFEPGETSNRYQIDMCKADDDSTWRPVHSVLDKTPCPGREGNWVYHSGEDWLQTIEDNSKYANIYDTDGGGALWQDPNGRCWDHLPNCGVAATPAQMGEYVRSVWKACNKAEQRLFLVFCTVIENDCKTINVGPWSGIWDALGS